MSSDYMNVLAMEEEVADETGRLLAQRDFILTPDGHFEVPTGREIEIIQRTVLTALRNCRREPPLHNDQPIARPRGVAAAEAVKAELLRSAC